MSRTKTFTWRLIDACPPLEPDTEYLVMHEPTPENKHYGRGTPHGACRMGPYYLYVDEEGQHVDAGGEGTFYGNWRISHFVRFADVCFTSEGP